MSGLELPEEGMWFTVNPSSIDRTLFEKEREDHEQEVTRRHIIEVFDEGLYGRPFETMVPKKTWGSMDVNELEEFACEIGDGMADWAIQYWEFAQIIANGAACGSPDAVWELLCNKKDTNNWYRVVRQEYCRSIFKSHYFTIGGSKKMEAPLHRTCLLPYDFWKDVRESTVPLVFRRLQA